MTGQTFEVDVLVVGGGGAGFRAAIGAREKGMKILLLSKGPLARCGATPMAGADYTLDGASLRKLGFFGEPKDSRELFFSDIVHQGYYLNNQKLVEQYVQAAPERLRELLEWGIPLRKSEERAIFTSGLGIMDALLKRARSIGVEMVEDSMLLDLVTEEGSVSGALALDIKTGEYLYIAAKAVIMATGGWHKAFWPNTGMRDLSGEGIAIAHRAGAAIGNMEFITFCCNILYSPPFCRGSLATYIMSLRVPGRLTNSEGETFLDKYDPYVVEKGTHMEWNKSFVSYASTREVRDGKGSHDRGIYYGRGDMPWDRFESIVTENFPKWKYKAIDLTPIAEMIKDDQPVEVGPAVEYFDGGILVDEQLQTGVKGLFAAGECTLGPFGANRVCAAITEMVVHGAEAGWNAADFAATKDRPTLPGPALDAFAARAEAPLTRKGGRPPAPIRRHVQEMAHRYLGPIRDQGELTDFIEFIEDVKVNQLPELAAGSAGRAYNKEWIDVLELENMVHLLECSAKSALFRTESRGVHYREDFPLVDNDNWLQESICTYDNEKVEISKRPAVITSLTPPGGVHAYLDMLKRLMEAHSEVGGHH
jgi:succinate dehydrogenase/fumarate reductase flavoprotein subunit